MLFYRILSFFWSNNRASLSAYCLGSIAALILFFFQSSDLEADFNALSLLSILNITFIIFSLLLSRNLLYKFYRNKTHYFFAQLPISATKMRLYEHACFFILCALPYFIALPFILFHVYFSGLWSNSQIIGFLSFQLILWFFFVNFSLCLAMLGRVCWYIFWAIAIGLTLYIKYNKNYEIDILGFFDVRRVLFKSDLITPGFIAKYLGASILFYIVAFFLSFTIDKNAFGFLHAKETSLSRGIFTLYLIGLASISAYSIHKLSLSKSKFSGLYLTQINAEKTNKRADFWSSSVQLNDQQLTQYAKTIARLNQHLIDFSTTYQLKLPSVHYQHHLDQTVLTTLHKEIDSDNDLELKFNFNLLLTDFYSIERDVIIEYLRMHSRGWIEKEDKLIYLRGLAAHWSWKNIDPAIINVRLQFLAAYPSFQQQFNRKQWLSIFQNSGACLFDALATSFIEKISSSTTKDNWHNFILTGLNLDHTWVPIHILRSAFKFNSQAEKLVADLKIESLINSSTIQFHQSQFDFLLETTQLYPDVFQVKLKTSAHESNFKDIQFHLYVHESPGQQIDFQSLQNKSFIKNNKTEHISQRLMRKNDRFSSTFSWYQQDLNCRVYAPWKYVTL